MSELSNIYTTVDARDRIVDAALAVFAQHGFDGATTREIARHAGVSSALIHHHFKDKESLWQLVGERISQAFIQTIDAATAAVANDGRERVCAMMRAYLQYWRDHPQALRFQLWRVQGAPPEERKARSERLNRHFVPVVQAAQAKGELRTDVPAGLLMLTVGGLVQYFLHSDVETQDALAVSGAPPMDDAALLDYLLGLIGATPPA